MTQIGNDYILSSKITNKSPLRKIQYHNHIATYSGILKKTMHGILRDARINGSEFDFETVVKNSKFTDMRPH